jgi:hypothetical protein
MIVTSPFVRLEEQRCANSASLTPVQGPSSITCTIVTSPFVRLEEWRWLACVAGGLEQKMKRNKRVTKEDKGERQRCRMGEATETEEQQMQQGILKEPHLLSKVMVCILPMFSFSLKKKISQFFTSK